MSIIAQFSASELELLASLPYKVGVYVSHADDEGGDDDDARELETLQSCIRTIAEQHSHVPLTAAIMEQTLDLKMQWASWEERSFNTPQDCRMAVSLLKGRITDDELKDFSGALIEIASSVAQAYGEFNSFDDQTKKSGGFGALLKKFTGGFSDVSVQDGHHPMNISASEGGAIDELKDALKP
jgi:hypothetical protein